MTTTDTLKLYAALHADVPETRRNVPEWCIHVASNLVKEDEDIKSAIARCRCSALEWACKNAVESRYDDDLCDWMYDGASDDSCLIDICRAIHAAKGGG